MRGYNEEWITTSYGVVSVMSVHPEADPDIQELIDWVQSQELVDVWCNGCGCFRRMNGVYAKYLHGEIEHCGVCRKGES